MAHYLPFATLARTPFRFLARVVDSNMRLLSTLGTPLAGPMLNMPRLRRVRPGQSFPRWHVRWSMLRAWFACSPVLASRQPTESTKRPRGIDAASD